MGIFKNDDQKSSQFGFDEKSMAGKASQGRTLDLRHHGRLSAHFWYRAAFCTHHPSSS